jgi:hypothetical protein
VVGAGGTGVVRGSDFLAIATPRKQPGGGEAGGTGVVRGSAPETSEASVAGADAEHPCPAGLAGRPALRSPVSSSCIENGTGTNFRFVLLSPQLV